MLQQLRECIKKISQSRTGLTALSGYAAMLSSMVVGLFSVPMALHFLTNEEFGLWNIMGQSLGYLLLLDFGVSASASRLLVEPLRERDEIVIGSWWTAIIMILIAQSFLVLAVGWFGKDFIFNFFEVSESLRSDTELLWGGLIVVNAIQLPFRAYTGVLYCQDRWYVMHLATIFSSWVNLLMFAGLLMSGFRTSAYLFASASSVACNVILWKIAVRQSHLSLCFSLRLFSFNKIKKIFGYSSGIFLVMIAIQVAGMSQSIIIGKVLGIGSVASFVVSRKSSTVVFQLIRRAFDAFNPSWMQLYVDGKSDVICYQWRQLMYWWIPFGVLGALGVLIFNRSFSMLYGGVDNYEGRLFDLMLAIWGLMQTFLLSLNFIFPLSSKVRLWAIIGLLDALLQTCLGILFTCWLGSSGLLLGSTLASFILLAPFLLLRGPIELGVSRDQMLRGLGLRYGGGLILICTCFGLLCTPWAESSRWWPSFMELFLACILVIGVVITMIYRKRFFTDPKEIKV